MGWKRVLPKDRYLVVHCHAVRRPFMPFGIAPIEAQKCDSVHRPQPRFHSLFFHSPDTEPESVSVDHESI
jgi:hypothetical protein